MAYTTINKSTDFFNTKLYTGNATERSITGVGFQPDFTWIKQRTGVFSHVLGNAISGNNKFLSSSNNSSLGTDSGKFKTFESDGFQVGTHNGVNQNSETYASWNWKAGGSTSLNTNGTNAATVSVNSTAGFSIVAFTGTGANATVGHGLGSAPAMIMIKALSAGNNWGVYHQGVGNNKYLRLNATNAQADSSYYFQNYSPTSSFFYLGSDGNVNASGADMIAFCFAEKTGFSHFGKYKGNGSSSGSFIYTGFKPAFVMIKAISHTNNWKMFDNKRDPINNGTGNALNANSDDAEDDNAAYDIDFLSNGFKNRNTNANMNNSSYTYIYMAFAEAPLVGTNNIPCTAR